MNSVCGGMGTTQTRNGQKVRIFSKRECEALGGTLVRNGECLRKEGGSFSNECKEDENPTPVQFAARVLNDVIGGENSDELPSWAYIAAGVGAIYLAYKVTQ
jgi:hypothetical protein